MSLLTKTRLSKPKSMSLKAKHMSLKTKPKSLKAKTMSLKITTCLSQPKSVSQNENIRFSKLDTVMFVIIYFLSILYFVKLV